MKRAPGPQLRCTKPLEVRQGDLAAQDVALRVGGGQVAAKVQPHLADHGVSHGFARHASKSRL